MTILNGNVNSLVQVINNIISNAIQAYNGETNKSIDFTIDATPTSIVFSIQDYGSGMSQKVKDKLFKEMITTKGKNGTGLGLFMSYSTIKANFHGNMTFESEEGKGTTFKIILPMK
jgi:signal transduction histidine kinase